MVVAIKITHPGALKAFGYRYTDPTGERHQILRQAARVFGKTNLIMKLNAIAVLNRNRNPRASRVFESDMHYVQTL